MDWKDWKLIAGVIDWAIKAILSIIGLMVAYHFINKYW